MGILVSKAVDITIDQVTIKPAGRCNKDVLMLDNATQCPFIVISYFCFCFAVVGVKLNISFWMNSFINATLKLKVRAVHEENQFIDYLDFFFTFMFYFLYSVQG